MSHELFRLTEKLYNTPHLITPTSLENALTYLNDRNNTPDFAVLGSNKKNSREPAFNPDTGVGVISVEGPLTYLSFDGICGESGCSYQQIQEEFDTLLSMGAKTILLDVDSNGGEAFGAIETGQYLRTKADEAGINLLSYTDGNSFSAGYVIASAAHEMVINNFGECGSIGVVVQLRNTNKAMKAMGVEDTFVFSGKNKIPFDSNGEFTQEFLQDVQTKIDALYESFTQYVSEMRGIDVQVVKDTEAATYLPESAKALGLVDRIATREEFFEYLATVVQGQPEMIKNKLFGKPSMATVAELENETMKLEELQTKADQLLSELTAVSEEKVTLSAQLAELASSKELLTTELTSLKETLASLQGELASKVAKELADKAAARKELIASLVQEDQREAMFTSLESLDDAAFTMVTNALKVKAAAEAADPLFQEQGVAAEGEGQEEVDGLTKLINTKFPKV